MFKPRRIVLPENSNDDTLTIGIGEHQGKVVLKFAKPCNYIVLTPEQARGLAQDLLLHAGSGILV